MLCIISDLGYLNQMLTFYHLSISDQDPEQNGKLFNFTLFSAQGEYFENQQPLLQWETKK